MGFSALDAARVDAPPKGARYQYMLPDILCPFYFFQTGFIYISSSHFSASTSESVVHFSAHPERTVLTSPFFIIIGSEHLALLISERVWQGGISTMHHGPPERAFLSIGSLCVYSLPVGTVA